MAAQLLCLARAADPDSSTVMQQAVALLQSGKTEQAIAELEKIIARWPGFFPAYSLLGVSYSQIGKQVRAHTYFQKAVDLAPASVQARNNLGVSYLTLRKPAEAAAQFRRVIAAEPSNVSAWVNLANSESQLGKRAHAVAALERAEALAPKDLEIQLALIQARIESGQTEAARRHVVTLGIEPVLALARKSLEEGRYQNAVSLLMAIEESQKNSAVWHTMIGSAFAKLDQVKPALQHMQKAVRLDPANEDRYLDLAEFFDSQNAADTVVTVLKTATEALPRSVKIRSALGAAYVGTGQTEKAEEILKSVIEEQPAYEVAYKVLGECYERAQEWEKLRSLAVRLKQLNEKNGYGWYYHASAEYHLLTSRGSGSLEAVHRSVERAILLDPNDWRSQVLWGRVLLDEKQNQQAVIAFGRAVQLNPEAPAVHYLLATTLKRMGRTAEGNRALAAFQVARAKEKARKSRRLLVEVQSP